jgi:hypothetical protein
MRSPSGEIHIDSLIALFESCTARITATAAAASRVSTGTFVAPGLILTTAHGLLDDKKMPAPSIEVRWNDRIEPATIEKILPPPYPDLALLYVRFTDHPCVQLEPDVNLYDEFYAYGYTVQGPAGDPLKLDLDGFTGGKEPLLKLKSGQVVPGFSGAPLLNLRSRRVAAFMRTTRDAAQSAGGRAIPVSVVFASFPEIAEAQRAYHAANSAWLSAAGLPLPETRGEFGRRLRKLREDYHWSHEDLRDRVAENGREVSLEAIVALEATPPQDYRLSVNGSEDHGPLESLAKALSVDVGYLLAGFPQSEIDASVFGGQVRRGEIVLKATLGTPKSFGESLRDLPNDEQGLLSLQFRDYQNEQAYALMFRLERMYSGLEMLTLNDPPMIFWDDEDVEQWIRKMHLDGRDAKAFENDYREYRAHFRHLVERQEKVYQVVLNATSFARFLKVKSKSRRRALVDDIIQFLAYPTFNLVFYSPPTDRWSGDNVIEEYEIICKTQAIPRSMEGTLSVVIQQTPSDLDPIVYCITPNPQRFHILQSDRAKIDAKWAEALDQYAEYVRRGEEITEAMQKEISREKLRRLRGQP